MASEVSSVPVNGNYAPHQGYGGIEQANSYGYNNNNNNNNGAPAASAATHAPPQAASTSSNASGQADIPQDEVGWYFVEQYYITLSRHPEKLYLFYAKRSQFVSGQESEKEQVCVGQRAINDKIKQLDFQDCKVRVTNVDSQSSDSNIVIQVVGEISNKSQPHKKFVQTFVLAAQPRGYFVLNDIFRYLAEEEDEYEGEASAQSEEAQPAPAAPAEAQESQPVTEEAKTLTSSGDPAAIESDAKKVDKELEEKLLKNEPAPVPTSVPVNGESVESPTAEAEVPPTTEDEQPVTATSELIPEKPKDPEPSPVATPPPKAAAPPAAAASKPAVPAAPKTWATLAAAAANKVATPNIPAPASSTTSTARATTPAGKASTSAAAPAPAPIAPAAAATPAAAAAQASEGHGAESQDEWTAVGGNHSRQQSRQVNGAPPEVPQYRGYIKNVFEHVDASELRSAVEKFGELAYFDIARQKNCAFVDFKTADGYNKATSTPIEIGDDKLYVEERRVRPGSTPYVPRGQYTGRGGRGGAGPGQGGPRGGFQGNRGNFAPRGRGGAGGPRGRGAPQAA